MNEQATLTRRKFAVEAIRNLLLGLTVLLLMVTASGAASESAGNADSPDEAVKRATRHILDAVQEQRVALEKDPTDVRKLVDEFIAPLVDFEVMGRLVLGRHWRTASTQQQQDFVREFRQFLVRFYAEAVTQYIIVKGIPEQIEVQVLPARYDPGKPTARVQTRILQSGRPPLSVDYTLYRRDHEWRAVDLKLESISLVINYRQSFANKIQAEGLDALIANLASRNGNA